MLLFTALGFLLIGVPSVLGAWHPSSSHAHRLVPGAFIIEVDTSASTLAKRSFSPAAAVDSVLGACKDHGFRYQLRQTFQDPASIFHGASIKVDEGVTGEDLAALEGVQNVWPVRILTLQKAPTSADNPAPTTLSKFVKRAAQAKRDSFYPHTQSGVSEAQDDGLLGAGIKIGVLDTGVDYTNPILGGCFGPGCHISFGYDFVGDNYDGETNSPVPSPDPFASCTTHGTHVAGVIGALPNSYGFTGVAPAATMGHYRILAAYIRAVNDGCDVINLSFGTSGGFISNTPTERMIDRASALGIATIAASGDYGTEGLFFTSQPAAALTAIGAGFQNSNELPAWNATLKGYVGLQPVTYIAATPVNSTRSYLLYFTSTDSSTPNDACNPLPASTPNLARYVTIVQRGTCTFATKYANIVAKGGTVMMIYNQNGAADYQIPQFQGSGLLAAVSLRREEGLALLAEYTSARGSLLRFSFPNRVLTPGLKNLIDGGLVPAKAAYGPTSDLYGATSLVAPGSLILSTWPVASGGIGVETGTSFSAPLIAGAVAILKSARRSEGLSVAQLRDLLVTTADLVPTADGSSFSSIVQQGSGALRLDLALAAKTLVSPSVFYLNDTVYSNYTQTLTLVNNNPYSVFYLITATTAQTLATYSNAGDILPVATPPVLSRAAVVSPPRTKVIVAAGATYTQDFTFRPPSANVVDQTLFPIYSGALLIKEYNADELGGPITDYHVTYFGLAARALDMPVLDTTEEVNGPGYAYPFLAGDDIQLSFASYARPNGPAMIFRQAGGSPLITVDVVPANISYQATIPTDHNLPTRRERRAPVDLDMTRSRRTLHKRAPRLLSSSVETVGNIFRFAQSPRDFLRNGGATDSQVFFDGTFTTADGRTGTIVVGTQYRLLLRALKVTGDPAYEDQYESFLSPPFAFTK